MSLNALQLGRYLATGQVAKQHCGMEQRDALQALSSPHDSVRYPNPNLVSLGSEFLLDPS